MCNLLVGFSCCLFTYASAAFITHSPFIIQWEVYTGNSSWRESVHARSVSDSLAVELAAELAPANPLIRRALTTPGCENSNCIVLNPPVVFLGEDLFTYALSCVRVLVWVPPGVPLHPFSTVWGHVGVRLLVPPKVIQESSRCEPFTGLGCGAGRRSVTTPRPGLTTQRAVGLPR